MKINCIYLCVIAEPWIDVAKELESKYGLKPKYVIHWEKESEKFKSNFPASYKYTVEEAWKGLSFPKNLKRSLLDEPLLNQISKYELIGIKMMDRLDPTQENFQFSERQNFFRDLVMYWLSVIRENDIKLVISPSIPHRVFDYALYVAAEIESIDFFMFQMVPFGSRTILIEDINCMGPSALEETEDECLKSEINEKIEAVRSDYKAAIPSYMVRQKEENKLNIKRKFFLFLKKIKNVNKIFNSKPNTYWVEKNKSPQKSKFGWFKYYCIRVKQKSYLKKLKIQYESLTRKVNFEKNYILVALHYQPEETSCPTGGVFVNQELIVQMLSETVPSDWFIYVKEHKSQFYQSMEGSVGRDLNFYHRLLNISPKVRLVSVDENPFNLIDRAFCTCTISGTIGWESALRGTPALHFGRAWYEGMPLTYKVKSLNDLKNSLATIKNKFNHNYNDSHKEFHYRLSSKFITAKHYKANSENGDVDFETSKNNLVKAIWNRISKVVS